MMLLLMNQMQNKGKGKEKVKVDIGMADFYKYYCNTTFKEKIKNKIVVHHNSVYNVKRSLYGEIIEFFHSRITDEIMLDNFEFKLPARLGILSIKKRKPKLRLDEDGKVINTMPVDWKATKELWEEDPESKESKKLVRHLNEHTNGFINKWCYDTYTATFKNKTVYKFRPTRTLKRGFCQILKDPNLNLNYYLK